MNTFAQILQDQSDSPHLTDSYVAAIKCAANAISSEFRIENILAPITSLEKSRQVFQSARWFLDHTRAKISVLFFCADDGSDTSPRNLQEEIKKVAGIRCDEFRAVLTCREAPNALHVTNAAKAEKADLLIIPADLFKGCSHFYQADPMDKLIHSAPCSVLIVDSRALPQRE